MDTIKKINGKLCDAGGVDGTSVVEGTAGVEGIAGVNRTAGVEKKPL